MKTKTCCVLLLLAFSAICFSGQTAAYNPNLYACRGITLLEEDALPPEKGHTAQALPALTSPNGKNKVEMVRPKVFSVSMNGRRVRTLRYPQINASIELGWSPDSTQFFLTYSDGGAIGNYHTHVFRLKSDRVQNLPYARMAALDFSHRHYCKTRGNNLFFLGWTSDSTNAFVVSEVYPTGDCEELGLFRGYLMDTKTGAIVRRFGENDTEAIKKSCRATGFVAY